MGHSGKHKAVVNGKALLPQVSEHGTHFQATELNLRKLLQNKDLGIHSEPRQI